MLKLFQRWYHRYFSDQEAVVLILILGASFVVLMTMGKMLAPVLTALVIAYLLLGLVTALTNRGLPYLFAVWFTYALFLGGLAVILLLLIPLTWTQLKTLLEQVPDMIAEGNRILEVLPKNYPELVTAEQVNEWVLIANNYMGSLGKQVVSVSVATLPNLISILIFLVLVPVLVFFFLKDKDVIMGSFTRFLPEKRPVISKVWEEMNHQISNYVRGKFIEIIIVGGVTYIALVILGVKYAALLGLLVGLSVVVPYIGAAVVTIPVALVGYFQFGIGPDFLTLIIVYAVIQALDGNVLVPLLFSEAVNLHPVSIIVAVLVFGGFWGLWGVFFAIPLATLIKAVLSAWPEVVEAVNEAEINEK